jgi:hypothetical protein
MMIALLAAVVCALAADKKPPRPVLSGKLLDFTEERYYSPGGITPLLNSSCVNRDTR